jgi:signal transduction histidine kinase
MDLPVDAWLRPVPSTLAETINHEFRNPLATLMGHLELLQDQAEELPADVVASLEAMERAGLRLAALVTAAADIAEMSDLAPGLTALVS